MWSAVWLRDGYNVVCGVIEERLQCGLRGSAERVSPHQWENPRKRAGAHPLNNNTVTQASKVAKPIPRANAAA